MPELSESRSREQSACRDAQMHGARPEDGCPRGEGVASCERMHERPGGDSRSGGPRTTLLFAVMAIAIAGLLHGWVFMCPADELGWRGEDDACYYYNIARNIVAGRGVTFDGVNPTNGFHPLWLTVVSGVFYVSPDDATALRLIYGMQWGFYVICAAIVGVLASRVMWFGWAASAMSLFLVLPSISRAMLNGMETALALACLLSAIVVVSRIWSRQRAMNLRLLGLASALLAAASLARLECTLMIIVVSGLIAFRGAWPRRWRYASVMALCSIAPVIVFISYSTWKFGAPMPVSGLIKRAAAAETAKVIYRDQGIPGVLSETLSLHMPLDGFATVLRAQFGYDLRPAALLMAGYVVMLAPLCLKSMRRRLVFPLLLLAAFAVLQIAINKVFYSGRSIPQYYWIPSLAIFPFSFVLLLESSGRLFRDVRLSRVMSGLAGMVCLLVIFIGARYQWHFRHATLSRKDGYYNSTYAAARWLSANTKPGDVAGAWNAGVIGFYSNRTVVNLDGYVNSVEYGRSISAPGANLRAIVSELPVRYLVDRISNGRAPLDEFPELNEDWQLIARVPGPRPNSLNGGFCVYERKSEVARRGRLSPKDDVAIGAGAD